MAFAKALKIASRKLDFDPKDAVCVTTAAMRKASNSKEVLEFLEKNSDFSLCFSNAKILQENNAENYNKMTIVENRKYQDTELLGKWLIPTASTLFINSFTTEDFAILSNPNVLFGDIFLFLILANKGNIKGMENYMTVYRINSESVTNQKKSIIYY